MGVSIGEVAAADARAAALTEMRGVKIQAFDPPDVPTPARNAGIEVGDVVIAANGQRVNRVSELQRIIRGFKPGDVFEIEAMRFGQKKSFRVRLGEVPKETADQVASSERGNIEPTKSGERSYDRLGITVQPVPDQILNAHQVSDEFRRGLLVTAVNVRGPAYRVLLVNTDVILRSLNPVRKEIRTPADLESVVRSLKSGEL